MTSNDGGPVLPLYLNQRECEHLALCVQFMLSVDLEDPELRASAEERDLGRADQVRAAARDRKPILMSLNTALLELRGSLERYAHNG